jgi:hypothetical protein
VPKQRQIPFLFPRVLANGETVYHWKPSARLRAAGFVNMKLGSDKRAAYQAAQDQNDAVKAWEDGSATTAGEAPAPRPVPRVVRFDELLSRYRASAEFTGLRKSTQREYNTRLRQLRTWAMDGTLLVRDIDKALVRDLRAGLLAGSIWRAASTLRVLRLLLQWAEDNAIVAKNVATSIDIPEPPSRKVRMDEPARAAIIEAAEELGMANVALAIDLAFWTLQRQGDILQLNRMAWRQMQDLGPIPRYARLLADPRGRVMGFRLVQQKTGTWIDAPIPPMLHDRIAAAFRDTNSDYVFAHAGDPTRMMTTRMFQRRFQLAQEVAAGVAIMRGDMALAEAIDLCQFRDLRRTGMIFYRSMGAKVPSITALSGHYVLGKKTIMDTYMPGDTAAAIECVAIGLEGWLAQQQDAETG